MYMYFQSFVERLPPSSHVKEPSVTAHYEHYAHDGWVHRRPVALAKLPVLTHHLSLFRVLWRLNF